MEIKFRVISGNEIVGEERLTDRGWEWMYYALNPDSGERWNSGTMDIENSSKKITRNLFSGLHDKNGKEIYEGDIVEVTTDNDNVFGADSYLFLVEFVNSGFFYKTNAGLVSLSFNRFTSALVAGNAYQHRHLLP